MDKNPVTGRQAKSSLAPQPVVLTPEAAQQVAGGLNPQPLPPFHEETRD
jgi:hypothetical protein